MHGNMCSYVHMYILHLPYKVEVVFLAFFNGRDFLLNFDSIRLKLYMCASKYFNLLN